LDQALAQELQDFLRELVAIAAAAALPYFRQTVAIDNKDASGFDPVTAADRETEDALRRAIEQRFPEHGIIGEERSPRQPDARYQWVIDPIDGTRAFICGLPTWATLVGLCDGGVPVLGLMSQPVVGEYFIGGGGESINGYRDREAVLSTSAIAELAQSSLFATSPDMFASGDEAGRFDALSERVRLTRYGVDSYAYCLLAAGHVELVAEAGLGFYDIAALIPIIEAAGGIVSDWHGRPVRGGGTVVAAANAALHASALRMLDA
jgi:histidinol phosphatase-like enzyme (inositol monophosphatase family)